MPALASPNSQSATRRSPQNERTRTHVRSQAFPIRSKAFPSRKNFPRERMRPATLTHAHARASQCVDHASECVTKVEFFPRDALANALETRNSTPTALHRTPPHVRSHAVPMRWSADPCCSFFRPTARVGAAGRIGPRADYTDRRAPTVREGHALRAGNRNPRAEKAVAVGLAASGTLVARFTERARKGRVGWRP